MSGFEELAGQSSGRAGRLAPLPQRPTPGFGEVLANGSNAEESPAALSSLLPPGHLSSSTGSGTFEPAHGPEAGAQVRRRKRCYGIASLLHEAADNNDGSACVLLLPLISCLALPGCPLPPCHSRTNQAAA